MEYHSDQIFFRRNEIVEDMIEPFSSLNTKSEKERETMKEKKEEKGRKKRYAETNKYLYHVQTD